jgi:hypothetical protein
VTKTAASGLARFRQAPSASAGQATPSDKTPLTPVSGRSTSAAPPTQSQPRLSLAATTAAAATATLKSEALSTSCRLKPLTKLKTCAGPRQSSTMAASLVQRRPRRRPTARSNTHAVSASRATFTTRLTPAMPVTFTRSAPSAIGSGITCSSVGRFANCQSSGSRPVATPTK